MLFIRNGTGVLTISGRTFDVGPETAALVAPGEGFTLQAKGTETMQVLISACPQADAPVWLSQMTTAFNEKRTARFGRH